MLDAAQAPEGQDAARKRRSSNQIISNSTRYATRQKKCKRHQGKATSRELQGRSRRLRTARGIVIRPSLPSVWRGSVWRGGTKQKLEASIFFFVENCGAFFSSQSIFGFIMPRQDAGAVEDESHEFLHTPKTQEAVAAGLRQELKPLEEMDQQ